MDPTREEQAPSIGVGSVELGLPTLVEVRLKSVESGPDGGGGGEKFRKLVHLEEVRVGKSSPNRCIGRGTRVTGESLVKLGGRAQTWVSKFG